MSQKAATAHQTAESSKKCFHGGLANFGDIDRCRLCKSGLSLPLTEAKSNKQVRDKSAEFGQLKVSLVLILAAVLAVLLVLVLYIRRDPQGKPEAVSEAGVVQPATPQAEQPGQDSTEKDHQSQEAAKHVLAGLKRFQDATERSMSYDEYDEMLTRLKADLNNTLPTFVRHNASDETFRQEVDAALREYSAARDWWKTCIRNSSVINDAERSERLQADWNSAQAHLDKAQKQLLP